MIQISALQGHDVVAHEVYGEDAIRVTPPPPMLQSTTNTSCLNNPTTSLPPSQTSTLMHGRASSASAMMQKSHESIIESSIGPNGDLHGYQNNLIPVWILKIFDCFEYLNFCITAITQVKKRTRRVAEGPRKKSRWGSAGWYW